MQGHNSQLQNKVWEHAVPGLPFVNETSGAERSKHHSALSAPLREHRKESRLRSAASQLLPGLGLSHDYVSKKNPAFTCQTLQRQYFSSPLSLSGRLRICFVSKEKHSLPHQTSSGFSKALKTSVHAASHHLRPGEQRSLQQDSCQHQRYTAALPGCSPDHSVIPQLGKSPGSAHFPDLPWVLLRPEMAPDLHTAPHTSSHLISCQVRGWHMVFAFSILY